MISFDVNRPFKGWYATVWEVKEENGFVKGRISTSRKKKDDTYVNSNWFVTFMGGITENAMKLKERDKILIDSISFENPTIEKNGEKKSYLNTSIWHFVMADTVDGNSTPPSSAMGSGFPKPEPPIKKIKDKEFVKVEDEEPAGLPFDL